MDKNSVQLITAALTSLTEQVEALSAELAAERTLLRCIFDATPDKHAIAERLQEAITAASLPVAVSNGSRAQRQQTLEALLAVHGSLAAQAE